MKLAPWAKRTTFWIWICSAIVALAATACRVDYYPTRVVPLQETVTVQLQDKLDAWRSRHGILGVALAIEAPRSDA